MGSIVLHSYPKQSASRKANHSTNDKRRACEVCGVVAPSVGYAVSVGPIGRWCCGACVSTVINLPDCPELSEAYKATWRRSAITQIRRHYLPTLPRRSPLRQAIEACLAAGDAAAIETAWQILADAIDEQEATP